MQNRSDTALVEVAATRVEALFAAFDQDMAMRHGWCMNLYGDGMVGIVKDDDSDILHDPDHAREHVALSSVASPDDAYRQLCAAALVLEEASVAVRDCSIETAD